MAQPQLAQAPLTITVVGDCTVDQVEAAARRWLGALPPRDVMPVQEDLTADDALLPNYPMVAGELSFTVAGQEPRTVIRLGLPTDDFGDIHQVRRLGMLSAVIRDLLRSEMREALGQVYSPWATHNPSDRHNGHGVLMVQASVAPDQAATAREVMTSIIRQVHENGIDEEVFNRVMQPQLQSLEAYRQRQWLLDEFGPQPQRRPTATPPLGRQHGHRLPRHDRRRTDRLGPALLRPRSSHVGHHRKASGNIRLTTERARPQNQLHQASIDSSPRKGRKPPHQLEKQLKHNGLQYYDAHGRQLHVALSRPIIVGKHLIRATRRSTHGMPT